MLSINHFLYVAGSLQ